MIKPFRHCKIQDTKKLKIGNLHSENLVLIFRGRRPHLFFSIGVLKRFAILEPFLIKLQAFFYRAPTVAASGFLQQQIPFSAKSGMYWRQSPRFLSQTLLKTRVKPQKQPLQLFFKKRCSQKCCKFHRKTSVSKSLFNRVAGQETQTQMFSCGVYEIFKN